jgi:hypothetical protein
MTEPDKIIYQYKVRGKTSLSGWGKKGTVISLIAFFAVFIPFIVFIILAITKSHQNFKVFIWLANIFGILSLVLGPFSIISKNFYLLNFYENGFLYVQSFIGFRRVKSLINLNEVSSIQFGNPAKSVSLNFLSSEGKILGRFNHLMMGREFDYLKKLISEKFPGIKQDI